MGRPGSVYASSDDLSNSILGLLAFLPVPGDITQVLVCLVLCHVSYANANESSHHEMPLQNADHLN